MITKSKNMLLTPCIFKKKSIYFSSPVPLTVLLSIFSYPNYTDNLNKFSI